MIAGLAIGALLGFYAHAWLVMGALERRRRSPQYVAPYPNRRRT